MPEGVSITRLDNGNGRKKERCVVVDTSMPMPGIVYTHNNSLGNLVRALGERLYKVPHGDDFVDPPRPVVFDCGDYADRVVSKMPCFDSPISSDEFVCLYTGSKAKRYAAAAQNVALRGLYPSDSEISVFLKDEKICSWSKVDPAPRLISPRTPEYCLELGRFIKPIEHLLYKAVARVWKEVTIFKGLNFNDRGEELRKKWEKYQHPVAIGLDASRFDQHVSVEALNWEHSIYLRCYRGKNKYLKYLLSRQLTNRGTAYIDDHKVEYQVNGGRMSGDMNTALGNCLIMTGLVYRYLQLRGLTASLANDGDDCVVIMERNNLPIFLEGLQEWFRTQGFTMKVEKPVFVFEEMEFCQCHPVWNGEQWTMCRNIHKALFTDSVHVGKTLDEILSIRYSIGECGIAWSRGVPVFGKFYQHILKTGVPHRSDTVQHKLMQHSGTYWNSKGCRSGTHSITSEARLSFERAFHISPSEQLAIEELYATLPVGDMRFSESPIVYNASIPCCEYPLFISDSLNILVFGC